MSKELEITKDITVAWLQAYQTDVAIRRQKGVVPLFTPTYEEVTNFITETYKRVNELSSGKEPQCTCSAEVHEQDCFLRKIQKLDLPIPEAAKNMALKPEIAPIPPTVQEALTLSLPKADMNKAFDIKTPTAEETSTHIEINASETAKEEQPEPVKKASKPRTRKKSE